MMFFLSIVEKIPWTGSALLIIDFPFHSQVFFCCGALSFVKETLLIPQTCVLKIMCEMF